MRRWLALVRGPGYGERVIRGLVFDLYGTLVTRGAGPRAYNELIRRLPLRKWWRARHAALTEPIPTVTQFGQRFGFDPGPDAAHYERLVDEGIAAVELYPDSVPCLEAARARGLKLALLSNLAAPYKRPVFELGLDAHFDALVFSCDVGMAKPSAKIYAHTARELGLAPGELLMIGDTRRDDVRGARRAGLRALHLLRERGGGDLQDLGGLLEHLELTR